MTQKCRYVTSLVIPDYMPDGPSAAGDIEMYLIGDIFTQRVLSDDGHGSIQILPVKLPAVMKSRVATVNDCAKIWESFDPSGSEREYLISPDYLDENRILILFYENGTQGYLMLFGECCFVSLVMGTVKLDFDVGSHDPIVVSEIEPISFADDDIQPDLAVQLRQAIPDTDGWEAIGFRHGLESMVLALRANGVQPAVIDACVTEALDAYGNNHSDSELTLNLNVFDENGTVVDSFKANMSIPQIEDIVCHAAQLTQIRRSARRSSDDTEGVLAELEEALTAAGIF